MSDSALLRQLQQINYIKRHKRNFFIEEHLKAVLFQPATLVVCHTFLFFLFAVCFCFIIVLRTHKEHIFIWSYQQYTKQKTTRGVMQSYYPYLYLILSQEHLCVFFIVIYTPNTVCQQNNNILTM